MKTVTNNKTLAERFDYFFNKLLPKKVIVITIATILVFKQIVVPVEYWYILMAYFGTNIAGKFAGALSNKNNDSNDASSPLAG